MTTSRILATGRADRAWSRRLAALTRSAVLVLVLLHGFGMRELTASQADDLYGLILTGRATARTRIPRQPGNKRQVN